jgi:hypothetical protein
MISQRRDFHLLAVAFFLFPALAVASSSVTSVSAAQIDSGSVGSSTGSNQGQSVPTVTQPTPNSVRINADGTMTVDGAPFKVQGVGQQTLS